MTMLKTQKEKSVQLNFDVKMRVNFVEGESNPEANYFFFAYKIFITNQGNCPAQLMSRHWVITDGNGHVEEVRGAGVVGAQPHIQPGQTFEYESACPLTTTCGSMRGSYQMLHENGQTFEVAIPEFFLIAPSALH
jgi:ApaG protein